MVQECASASSGSAIATCSRMWMDGIDPIDCFWRFNGGNVQIYHDRLLTAADQHADEFLILAGVDFLMRDKRRHIDKISRPGLGNVLQMIAPTHTGTSMHHINHTLQIPMVVGTSFGMGMDSDGAGPELAGPRAGMGNGGSTGHACRLGGVQIERTALHHPHTVLTPVTDCFLRHAVP